LRVIDKQLFENISINNTAKMEKSQGIPLTFWDI